MLCPAVALCEGGMRDPVQYKYYRSNSSVIARSEATWQSILMKPYLGAHLSTAGGLHKALEKLEEIGGNALQIFGASPRTWQASLPKDDDVALFKEAAKRLKIDQVFLHAAYLPNLASPDKLIRDKSIKNLSTHLEIANLIGAKGLIFHIGSGKDSDPGIAKKHVVEGCLEILKNNSGESWLIMENSAGGGAKLGVTIEEIGEMVSAINHPQLKVCLDTAHSFESGLIEKYSKEELAALEKKIIKILGKDKLVSLHVNDSKTIFNSHHDKHENIGDGFLPKGAFQNLANNKLFASIPWLLETPGLDGMGPDKINIDRLKALY